MARSRVVLASAVVAMVVGAIGAPGQPRAADGRAPMLRHVTGAPPGAGDAQKDRHQAQVSGFVLTSPLGVRVFLDVVRLPDDLAPALDDPRNLLVATNGLPDHLGGAVVARFRGAKRVNGAGTLQSGDVRVEVLDSSRIDDAVDGTNHIAVVDLGGVRVVHVSDCGQRKLTAEQRARIGRVDVLIGEFLAGVYDDDPLPPALELVRQLAPRVIIPTHLVTTAALAPLVREYRSEVARRQELALTPALLGGGKRIVFMGANGRLAADAGVTSSEDL